MRRIIILLSFLLILPIFCHAAPGDTIASDLKSTASAGTYLKRIVETTGCAPGGTGECVKMDCYDGHCGNSDSWLLDIPDTKEITLVYWERYSTWPLTMGSGAKGIRPYTSGGSYYGATMTSHSDHGYTNGMYLSTFTSANLYLNYPYATGVNDYDCKSTGSYAYNCTTRMGIEWSPDGGITDGMGTEWREMRMHIRMPTSYSSGDGEVSMWVDDNLIYTLSNIDMVDSGGLFLTSILFAPDDTAPEPHEHWYDEITVYEGYVPPETASAPRPLPPTGFRMVVSVN